MTNRPSWSSSWKEAKTTRCLYDGLSRRFLEMAFSSRRAEDFAHLQLDHGVREGVLVLEPATGPSSTPDPRRRPTAHNTLPDRALLYCMPHRSREGSCVS